MNERLSEFFTFLNLMEEHPIKLIYINVRKNNIDLQNFVMFFRLLQVTIKIVTKSLESKPSSLLISTNNLGMASVALPDGINTKKIWKAEHQKKTVAVFQYLSILDASGNTHIYPAGDYVAVGADRIALK